MTKQLYDDVIYNADQWEIVKQKSEAHNQMVLSYLDCRNGLFGDNPSECQLALLQYGKLRNYENSQFIIEDIIKTSDELAANPLFGL